MGVKARSDQHSSDGQSGMLDNPNSFYPEGYPAQKPIEPKFGSCRESQEIVKMIELWSSGNSSLSQTIKFILRTLERGVRFL